MAEIVNVIVKEDPSVQKALDRTAKKLKNKYSKRRPINQNAIRSRTPFQIFTNVVLNVLTCILVVFAGLVCISSVNSSMHKVCPSFAGYSNFRIVSPSMVASGHKIGDTIIVRAVDAKTLKPQRYENGKFIPGDKIAFYQSDDISRLYPRDATLVDPADIGERKYTFEFNYLFGTKNSEMVKAAQSGCNIVFHHVYEVRVDEDGVRWFKTYGSSNGLKVNKNDTTASPDGWWVREDLVVGVYDDAPFSIFMSKVIGAFSASGGVFLLFIPVGLLVFLIVRESVRDVQMAKLELDCVEEKRKITDEICVKNGIGYRMSKKTKYKILVQADEKDRLNYISLMWRDNTVPREVKKYVLRKQALMKPTQRLLEVNRQCQQMFREGVDPQKIAKYYAEEKAKVEAEETAIRQRVRELRKTYEAIYLADKAEQEKLLANKKNRGKFETIPQSEFLPDDDRRKQKWLKKNKAVSEPQPEPVVAPVEPKKEEIKVKPVQKLEPRKRRKLDTEQEREKNEQVAKVLLNSKMFSSKAELEEETSGGVLVPKSLIEKEKNEQAKELKEEVKEEVVEEIVTKAEEQPKVEKPETAEVVEQETEVVTQPEIEEISEQVVEEVSTPFKELEVEDTPKEELAMKETSAKEEKVAKVAKTAKAKPAEKKPAKKTATSKPKVENKVASENEDKSGRKPRAKSKKVKRVFTTDSKRLPRARKK